MLPHVLSQWQIFFSWKIAVLLYFQLFLAVFHFQIYVISLAEPRLPLQLDDAIRPEVEGEEVKTTFQKYCADLSIKPWKSDALFDTYS